MPVVPGALCRPDFGVGRGIVSPCKGGGWGKGRLTVVGCPKRRRMLCAIPDAVGCFSSPAVVWGWG